jgi:hypothetical protein
MSPEELKFFQEVEALLTDAPQIIEYRLYYNSLGDITVGTMIVNEFNDTLTDPFLVVSKTEYDNYFNYRVVNGKLKLIDRDPSYQLLLHKSDSGTPVVKGHAGLIIEKDETYTDIEYYAYTNN